jgi:hypothetical protein
VAFTEFYCDASSGNNMNGGSSAGSATVTYTNGGWSTATNTFTPASGDPSADGVTVGDFVSIYTDGATAPVFLARVTAVTSTTFTVSATARGGTPPTTAATGISASVAGAWKGPNGTVAFPVGFNLTFCTNASGDPVRVNLKNNASYVMTAGITANVNAITFQGYGSSPGDLGRATIDGGSSGASYPILTTTTQPANFIDLIFQNNGATGSADGVTCSISGMFQRCTFTGMRGSGINAGNVVTLIECEAYGNNTSNTAGHGGFRMSTSSTPLFLRCVAHDNTGTNSSGFVLQGNNAVVPTMLFCIADSNGLHGVLFNNAGQGNYRINSCTFYNNGVSATGDGVRASNAGHYYSIENCNFVSNSGFGINHAATATSFPQLVLNCGFYGNGSGETNGVNASWITGKVTYSSAPLVDPANGNFALQSAQGQGTGRGSFTQDAGSYASRTTSYPDIGAAQAVAGGASAVFTSAASFGRRYFRPEVHRKPPGKYIFAAGPTIDRVVPLRVESARLRGRPVVEVRPPAPRIIPVPAQTIYLQVPVRTTRLAVVTRPTFSRVATVVQTSTAQVPFPYTRYRGYPVPRQVHRPKQVVPAINVVQQVVVSHPRVVR